MDRSRSVDALKLCMALCVLCIHSNPAADISRALVGLTGDGLFRIAVPVFLLLNGYYFRPMSDGTPLWPYLRRVLGLYALWMGLYLPLWWQIPLHASLPEVLRTLVFGWWHLWYLAGLAMAAAVAGLVAQWPTGRLAALAAATFALGVAVQYGLAFGLIRGAPLGDTAWLHRNGLLLGLPFFLGGALIRRHGLDRRLPRRWIVAAAIAGPLLVLAESAWLHAVAPRAFGLDNLATIAVAAPALVLLALQGPAGGGGRTLGTLSAGIFFLHVAFVAPLIRDPDLSHALIAGLAALGSVAVTLVLVRLRLDRRLF